MVILFPLVNAVQWNDRLIYSDDDLKVRLDNWWGLGKTLGTAELKSHKSVDEIRPVRIGKSVVMWYDFNFNDLYLNGLGDVEIIDMETGELVNRDYEFVYWGNETYQVPNYNCERILSKNGTIGNECFESGTVDKQREVWLPYNSRDLPNKEIRIGIKINILIEETLDIVWKVAGKRINKHAVVSSGAVETFDGAFTILTYLNDGTFNTTTDLNISILIIAGGGSGGIGGASNRGGSGGGGSGEYYFNNSYNLSAGNYNVFVGRGGVTNQGANSSFDTIEVSGGGRGGNYQGNGQDGGSGGGASGSSSAKTGGNALNVTGQGFKGGDNPGLGQPSAAGGGGSGSVGQDATTSDNAGNGGVGLTNSINGTSYQYACGGGGASWETPANDAVGGCSSAGNGTALTIGWDALNGTGSGGGGGTNAGGGLGGNGVIIIRFSFIDITVTLNSPVDTFNSTSTTINTNGSIVSPDGIVNVSLYIDNILNQTNSSGINDTDYLFTVLLPDGNYAWNYEACNSEGCVNGTSRTITVDTVPTINVLSPLNVSFTTSTIFFNATASLLVDKWIVNYNGTNVTLSEINTSLQVEDGSHQLLLYANNSVSGVFGLNDSIYFSVDTTPSINVSSPLNVSFTTSTIFFNATASLSVDKWIVNYNGTNVTLSEINTSLEVEDGSHHLFMYANNSVSGVFGLNDSIFFSVDATLPFINITSPRGDQGTFVSGINLTLAWNVIDTNLDTCWYEYESINTTVVCSANTTNFTVTDSAATSLIFYANDTVGNLNSSTTTWSYSFIENSVTFNGNVSETSSQFFEINLSTNLNVLSISAQLNYNGTNYTSIASCGDFCLVNNTFDIPLVLSGESALSDFFWNINIFNGTDSINVITSTREQNVSRIHLETCDGTFTVQSLNFTASNERNLTRINPYQFDATFEQWLGSGSIRRSNNFTNSSITEKTLCISPSDQTYFIDAQIEYDEAGNGTTYIERNYFFQNNTISNVNQDISLYLLESSLATSFILFVQDDNLLPLEGQLVITERFYPGEDLFRIVQIGKTPTNGKTIGFFETEIVDYRFIINSSGQTLLTTIQQKIIGETAPFTLTFTIGELTGAPWSNLEGLNDLTFDLDFDKSSNIITYTYVDTSGDFTLGTLVVERINSSFATNTIICNLNSSQSSATLVCNLTEDSSSGTYNAGGFVTRGTTESLVERIVFIIETITEVIGLYGVFLAFFLILIASFAFKFNEIAGIFMINATVIFVNIIGLVSFGMLAISALLAVSIVIVVVMQR